MIKSYFLLFTLCFSILPPAFGQADQSQDLRPRGMFVSLIQNPPVLGSREAITELVRFSKEAGIRTLFVQIYRANQAWFPSMVGDSSRYEEAFNSLEEDPFALLLREAHGAGLEVHAWLNLLSLSQNEEAPLLKKYGPDILTRNVEPKNTLKDYQIDSQYFLEPGDPRVRAEMETLVREILETYPELDGLQFDYIRYPDTKPAYGHTPVHLERFKQATGVEHPKESDPLWRNWKRRQVTEFLEGLVRTARAIRPSIPISTTGCSPQIRALEEAFQEWPAWVRSERVDFVTLMSYSASTASFESYVKGARNDAGEAFSKVNIAIGAYKLVQTPEIFEEQWGICEKTGGRSCVVFHYGSLLENEALKNPLRGWASSRASEN